MAKVSVKLCFCKLILLVDDKSEIHEEEFIYSISFTQIFSRIEFDDLLPSHLKRIHSISGAL
ncbi:MAG: hypothetical protein ACI9NY_002070 [Kiritimatiellia bacterium]|jgi:hypothetical protein